MARPEFGRFGVWLRGTDYTPELAAGLEDLGYGTLWVGGSPDGDLRSVERLLAATSRVTVATGIVNIWKDDAATVGASFRRIEEAYPGRFVLGIGAGHRESTGDRYDKPYTALQRYLDVLDAEGVPQDQRVLAALGPRTLRLAADRAAGAHPYFTAPNHTRQAREILGEGPLLAPEQKVALESSPPKARALARASLGFYIGLANYAANFRRMGFTDDDLADGGSDRMVDSLIAHGTPEAVCDGLTAHLSAGADHVAVQLLVSEGADLLTGYRTLAAALGLPG
ncbi:LLM class F420-dependent oxidoreductase [Thermostaphylospora chromogena]|uniref:Probable F420-dependent oxidoreductase, MSMEG_4141 family n=1 Tax=Thermostaphylospora chromogena TaxID=35622 RepID=A0A1H1BGB5_9ACTN|nr:LLM class F420-dependent oxidoreductase [Thermostaphylospora chromogena]SDQ51005.1 probable F420-dependent oxidoreductase, MSMEG_4141 family [Thermostaphylospora chromogena]